MEIDAAIWSKEQAMVRAETAQIRVEEIHCVGCENTIRTGLSAVRGVRQVDPSAATNTVNVVYDLGKTSRAQVREHLADLGFTPVD